MTNAADTATGYAIGDQPADPFAAFDTTDTEKGITTVRVTSPLLLAARRAALDIEADDDGDSYSTDTDD